jgi:hypothetical protein
MVVSGGRGRRKADTKTYQHLYSHEIGRIELEIRKTLYVDDSREAFSSLLAGYGNEF